MLWDFEMPSIDTGHAALVALIRRYLDGMLDPFLFASEAHKLAYFAQESGEPLGLQYFGTMHGPQAENLGPLLRPIVEGLSDGDPYSPLLPVPGILDAASDCLENRPESRERVDRVARLIEGFESPYGLELLSLVHWHLKHEGLERFDAGHLQGLGGNRFSLRQFTLAANRLAFQGWI